MSSRSMVVLALATAAVVGAAGAPAAAAPAASAEPVAAPMASAETAVPGLAPAGASTSAVYLDEQGRAISRAGGKPYAEETAASDGVRAALLGCTPVSGRDNPHYSSGDVSGHGWWDKGSCSASTAHVYNCLYEFYTDNTWRQKACSAKLQLRPGGGSGNRTTARARCNPTAGLISWRNHVDVDVDGQIDTGEQPYNQANVVCVVF